MGGRNGGAMKRSKRDTEEAAKKNKVVTMPRTDSGKDAEETEKGEKKTSAKKALRHEVKRVVRERGGEIADTLMDKAKEGDLHSTEILLELMEKKEKRGGEGDDGQDGPSLAEQLMEGPTWEDVLEARRKAKEEEEAGEAASSR